MPADKAAEIIIKAIKKQIPGMCGEKYMDFIPQ